MKVLLPVHSTVDAKLTIDFVSNFHWPPYSCFKVIHVVEAQSEQQPLRLNKTVNEESFYAEDGIPVITYMRSRLATLLPSAVVEYRLLSGEAARQIIACALDWQADMIVMGARTGKHGDWKTTGSVSRVVVMDAPCSVVTIRPPLKTESERLAVRSLNFRTA